MEKYTKKEKDDYVRTYFSLKYAEVPVSLRSYAAHIGVKYYTFRDWYRDYKASEAYQNISVEEYSEKRRDEAIADDGFSFVMIGDGGAQQCF